MPLSDGLVRSRTQVGGHEYCCTFLLGLTRHVATVFVRRETERLLSSTLGTMWLGISENSMCTLCLVCNWMHQTSQIAGLRDRAVRCPAEKLRALESQRESAKVAAGGSLSN
jgi:hypothetical protein